MQVIIVGAGLAGLASAVACRDKGHDVQVLESTDRIGGRMATEIIDGCRCDVGFHVLHTAYPTLERWIDVDALEAGPMDPVTGLIDPRTGRQSMLGDPLRAPSTLIGTLRTSGVWDGLRMLAWRRRAKKAGWDRPDEGLALLDDLRSRGFSESFLDEVIIPLFRGILLDPEVRTSAAFASFVWHAMASGPLVLPKEGIGAVPNQLAARLPEGCVRTSTRVRSVTSRTVELEEGDHLEADLVLIATAHRSARMLVHGGAPLLHEQAPHPSIISQKSHRSVTRGSFSTDAMVKAMPFSTSMSQRSSIRRGHQTDAISSMQSPSESMLMRRSSPWSVGNSNNGSDLMFEAGRM